MDDAKKIEKSKVKLLSKMLHKKLHFCPTRFKESRGMRSKDN